MTIPTEILLPAVVSIILAIIAHFVSIMMQNRSNKHEFSIKTVGTIETELRRTREELESVRRENRVLNDSNTDLRGLRYRLEADLERAKETILERDSRIENANLEISSLKEDLFQAKSELELTKKRVTELEGLLSD